MCHFSFLFSSLWLTFIPPGLFRKGAVFYDFRKIIVGLIFHRNSPFIYVGMPHKPKFQHRKKKEREKRLLRQDQPQATTVSAPVVVAQESSHECSSITSLHDLHTSLVLPSRVWTDLSPDNVGGSVVCKVTDESSSSSVHPRVTHCLTVNSDRKWKLLVLDRDVSGCAEFLLFQRDSHVRPFHLCFPSLIV